MMLAVEECAGNTSGGSENGLYKHLRFHKSHFGVLYPQQPKLAHKPLDTEGACFFSRFP